MKILKNFFTGTMRVNVKNSSYLLLNKLRIYKPTDIQIKNTDELEFNIPLSNKKEVLRMLSREDVIFIENKNALYFLNFFYTRLALTISAVICISAFFVFNNFVYSIDIVGLNYDEQVQVRQYLQEQGITRLTYKSVEKAEQAAIKLSENFDFIAHSSAKLDGNTLIFSVYRVDTAEVSADSDLIAAYDAVITSVKVISGVPLVTVGDVVKKGDVLIKGEYQVNAETFHPCRAVGEILGEVKYTKSSIISDTVEIMARTGVSITKTDVYCPQFHAEKKHKGIDFLHYESEQTRTSMILFLKFDIVKTTYYELEKKTQKVDLNTYKNTEAEALLTMIKAESGITDFDKVDRYFTPIGGMMSVEVVATLVCSLT